eukprot:CAMPEP_0168852500 /NCGR_PEP_ID=MMETSP0727-20121128/13008_1 /TAXON_ID=265536 /ORGANISM="Amphiprora sp., Strain CCMP467" /LENGTH=316 /DNA_ID=CAMNT_0008906623 /DNA_START=101 /DNA_END=1051 /DNA_ORIENTATION=+
MMPRHTARSSDYLQPRTILENLSWCPFGGRYVALHMDSIAKILNHILVLAFLLDAMLFFTSWSVSFLPVWLVLNHHRISIAACLAPTEFKVGMAFGLCVGAAILSFFVSHAFARPAAVCEALNAASTAAGSHNNRWLRVLAENNATATVDDDDTAAPSDDKSQTTTYPTIDPSNVYLLCSTHKGSMVAVWFWSGLSFWCNFCACLLIWVGQGELANATPYENLSMDDYEDHFRRQQVAGTVVGGADNPNNVNSAANGNGLFGTPAFVGDYATVPEIRPDQSMNNNNNGASSSQPSGYGPTSNTGYSDTPAPVLTSV